jgi:hypothetical protein
VRDYIFAMYYDLENDISIAIIANSADRDDTVKKVLPHRDLAISIKDILLAD